MNVISDRIVLEEKHQSVVGKLWMIAKGVAPSPIKYWCRMRMNITYRNSVDGGDTDRDDVAGVAMMNRIDISIVRHQTKYRYELGINLVYHR